MNDLSIKEKLEILDRFAESTCDVRLSLQNGVEGRTGYIVLAPVTNGDGEQVDTYMHYHISDKWGLVPLKVRDITPFSLKEDKGQIRIDSGYKGVFG